MVIRRAVPAIAATLAVYAGLAFTTGLWLREHYITPLVTSNPNPPGSAWVISGWYTKGGTFAFGDHSNGIVRAFTQLCGAVGGRVRHVGGACSTCSTASSAWPSTLHALYQLPARQPVLAVPVDRGRLAARPVNPAPRRHHLLVRRHAT